MSAPTVPKPTSLLPDEQPVATYRSVAPMAIVAVVLGVASSLILTSPLLAPVPVAGIVVGIAALRAIRTSNGQLAGQVPAIFGLSLSAFFLGFGLSQHVDRQLVLEREARKMAEAFLRLLEEGRVQEAHQFRLTPTLRIAAPEARTEHYEKNVEAAKELQTFVTSTGVKEIIARGTKADWKFDSVTSATRDNQTDLLVLKYSYLPADDGERKFFWLHINRKFDESNKRYEWETGGIANIPPTGTE